LIDRVYHVWFGTKMRRAILAGEIDDDVRRLVRENALRTGVRLLEVETAVDHVHLIIGVPEDRTLSSAMHQIKGATSHAVFLKYPQLKLDMREGAFWQKSYTFRRLEPGDIPAARRYVRTQQSRPLRHE
jgi:putative transposase